MNWQWHIDGPSIIFLAIYALVAFSPYILFFIGLVLMLWSRLKKRSIKYAELIFAAGVALLARECLLWLLGLFIQHY